MQRMSAEDGDLAGVASPIEAASIPTCAKGLTGRSAASLALLFCLPFIEERSRKLVFLLDLLDSQFASIQLLDDELLETDAASGRADGDRKAKRLEGGIVFVHAVLWVRGSIAWAQTGPQGLRAGPDATLTFECRSGRQ